MHRIVQYKKHPRKKQRKTRVMALIHGTVALVGAGEYLPTMADVDKELLSRLGGAARVIVLPTAAVPDGAEVMERWATMGREHFSQLGASAEAVMLRTRADANDDALVAKLATANFLYFSGGKPRYLLETLRNTAAWRTIRGIFLAGGVIVGCSAGAMVLGEMIFDFPQIWRTLPALGLVPDIAVIPHFNELPSFLSSAAVWATRKTNVIGIDSSTVLVWSQSQWTVMGSGRVTVFTQRRKVHYTAGERVPLAQLKKETSP
jgi:cyanophycinase